MRTRLFRICALCLVWALRPQSLVWGLDAAGSAPSTQAGGDAASAGALAGIYKISPDDVLDISVVDVPEYSHTYRVAPDGTIRLPLLNEPIMAAGRTPVALAGIVTDKLTSSQLLHDPHVMIEVKESRANAIAVTGAVKTPQNYQVFGRTTLLNVISQAGGLTDDASNTAVIKRGKIAEEVFRTEHASAIEASPAEAASAPIPVNLKQLFAGAQSENLDLYPGDSVVVQRAGIIYVVGAVNKAGGFVLNGDRGSMTVLKAVALAEDLKPTAEGKKALLIRKNPSAPNGAQEFDVNLSKILSNKAPDSPMLADDVLFVPDSNAKKIMHRAGEAAMQAATVLTYGAFIYK
ncbi:MAG TPA: polysaccharide biosynthesis/export family protein [Bryobacteraceae bacterium]|nr:polysaccharide biosynthesis/export family protein [Bryobacteraceae bacterium]